MPTIQILLSEHECIERELIELETIMYTSVVNYSNFLHVLKKLKSIWDEHEQKEERLFSDMLKKGFAIPVKKITFEHSKLKSNLNIIMNALQSKNQDEMHTVLFKYGKDLISKLRQHMNDEDWILRALPKRF